MPDMRELLEIARAEAPPPRLGVDDIVRAGRRRQRWMRTQAVGGGAMVVAVVTALVLVGSGLLVSGHRSGTAPDIAAPPAAPRTTQPATPSVPPFHFVISPYAYGDYR